MRGRTALTAVRLRNHANYNALPNVTCALLHIHHPNVVLYERPYLHYCCVARASRCLVSMTRVCRMCDMCAPRVPRHCDCPSSPPCTLSVCCRPWYLHCLLHQATCWFTDTHRDAPHALPCIHAGTESLCVTIWKHHFTWDVCIVCGVRSHCPHRHCTAHHLGCTSDTHCPPSACPHPLLFQAVFQ